jgi:hypothetical protein
MMVLWRKIDPSDLRRFYRWRNARISVKGRPDWIFIKLYSHAFFEHDQDAMIGEKARRFLSQVLENGERTGEYRVTLCKRAGSLQHRTCGS